MLATDIVEARTITQIRMKKLKFFLTDDEICCNWCDTPVSVGDKIGFTLQGEFAGFLCLSCFRRAVEGQRMN